MTQGMEEAGIADPALLLDQVVVHDGDVGRGAAEADPSELEPEPQGFLERRPLHKTRIVHLADSGARERHRRLNERILLRSASIMTLQHHNEARIDVDIAWFGARRNVIKESVKDECHW